MATQTKKVTGGKNTNASRSTKSGNKSGNNSATKKKKTNPAPGAMVLANGKGGRMQINKSKKKPAYRSNPNFAEFTRAAKSTLVGTGGAFLSKMGGDVSLGLVGKVAPQIAGHRLASPIATFGFAWFVTPRVAKTLGMSQQSAEIARMGGLIATGLEAFDLVFPDVRTNVMRRVSSLTGGGGARDTRAVETTARTAIQPAEAAAIATAAAETAASTAYQATMAGLSGDYDYEDDEELLYSDEDDE